ncbi:hypothetical protein BDV36DRAFT_270896 [Aspergillus pseudocaelatus]|uniref:MADS-box domain-containing protein n=1 Tax=Aspergillus pseudocaelatus TaxID=1825620 RepID=A0ABQ6W677_9EURO|nr:hypothetical protein BDV36DRAFT_270896 [Aspergillus pseudocaelatus]
MATKKRPIQRRRADSAKSKCQQRNRRMTTLFRKAFEYCLECEADVSIMLRVRHTGQIVYFNSDGDGWPLSQVQLTSCYPVPRQITWQELTAQYNLSFKEPGKV